MGGPAKATADRGQPSRGIGPELLCGTRAGLVAPGRDVWSFFASIHADRFVSPGAASAAASPSSRRSPPALDCAPRSAGRGLRDAEHEVGDFIAHDIAPSLVQRACARDAWGPSEVANGRAPRAVKSAGWRGRDEARNGAPSRVRPRRSDERQARDRHREPIWPAVPHSLKDGSGRGEPWEGTSRGRSGAAPSMLHPGVRSAGTERVGAAPFSLRRTRTRR